jgi:hypothetical protein
MQKKYILQNDKIVEKYVYMIGHRVNEPSYYYLLDSEDSVVNPTRPTMTHEDKVFDSPRAIVDMLMEEWHETKSTDHPNQTHIEFGEDTFIKVGTIRATKNPNPPYNDIKEIWDGKKWILKDSLAGNALYRLHFQSDIGNGLT